MLSRTLGTVSRRNTPSHTLRQLACIQHSKVHTHEHRDVLQTHTQLQALGGVCVLLDLEQLRAMSHLSWPPSCKPKVPNHWSLVKRLCVCVWLRIDITAVHVTIEGLERKNASGWTGPYCSLSLPSVILSASLHWDLQVTGRSLLVSNISHNSSLPSLQSSSANIPFLSLQTPKPPSSLKMSANRFTLIKWDSVSVQSQAKGNSRNKWNCLWECGLDSACVIICLSVWMWAQADYIAKVHTCVTCRCDVKTLSQRSCRGKEGKEMSKSSRMITVCATK